MISAFETIGKRLERICTEKCIPLYAVFELTYRCNLRCRHCYAPKDCGDELSLEEIESILDQLVQMGTFNLILTGGEIFVREDFFHIAEAAKSRGFLLILMTNGTLITEDYADKIAKLRPMGVEVSLYGARAETHDFVTTVSGSFDHTAEAIGLLVGNGVRVIAKSVLMNSNVKEHKEIEALAKDLGAIPNVGVGIIPRKDGSLLPLKHDLSFEDMRTYLTEHGESADFPRPVDDPAKRVLCKAGKAVCCISPSGEVSPCVLMPENLGSLREQTMAEIWYQEGNRLLDRIRSPTAYQSSPCINCDLLQYCVKCPGVAYIEVGDPFGRSPTACRYARWRASKTPVEVR